MPHRPATVTDELPALRASRALDTAPRWLVPLLIGIVLLPRAAAFGVSENLYGDSVARMDLAQRWAQDPHWISSFEDGAQQYGPLHIMVLGAALWVDPDPLRSGRWVSLLFGVLTVLPLYALTRRLFGWRAGAWACIALAAWGMHVQCSVTAASEAVALFWLFAAFYFVHRAREPGRLLPLVLGALCMNVAAAVRYDPWMLMPLMALLFLFGAEDRAAGVTRAILFGAMCVVFPLLWIHGNELAHGDGLYPLHFTNQYHHVWARQELQWMPELEFRLRGLWFWPGAALFTLTPVVALLGAIGAVRSFRLRRETRWLIWLMVIPTAYYSLRQLVFVDFVPLARFAAPQIALLLPFVFCGAETVAGWARTSHKMLLVVATGSAFALNTWLALFTFDRQGKWEDSFRPVSPVTRNPPPVRAVARLLAHEARSGAVVLDADPLFWDLQLAAFSRIPEERLIRARWPDLNARIAGRQVTWAVVAPGGEVERAGWSVTEDLLRLPNGTSLERVRGLASEMRVYRAPRR